MFDIHTSIYLFSCLPKLSSEGKNWIFFTNGFLNLDEEEWLCERLGLSRIVGISEEFLSLEQLDPWFVNRLSSNLTSLFGNIIKVVSCRFNVFLGLLPFWPNTPNLTFWAGLVTFFFEEMFTILQDENFLLISDLSEL